MKYLLSLTLLLAIYTHESVSGLNKICYYNAAGSQYAITIKSHQICPRSIRV